MVTVLMDVRDLMVEAEGLEACYGDLAKPYVDYLRRHKRRPPPEVAQTIGTIIGGRVRADNNKMYPARIRPSR
jgi:hypothetical protein